MRARMPTRISSPKTRPDPRDDEELEAARQRMQDRFSQDRVGGINPELQERRLKEDARKRRFREVMERR